jgi:protein gp37
MQPTPLDWKRPRMIFVNSMSDLFHKDIPTAHISAVFDTMEKANWHIYQVLTKRSSLLQKFINARYKTGKTPSHMWFGMSVENQQATSRIAHLQNSNAGVRFLSIEPLIAPVERLNLKGIDCVIVGRRRGFGLSELKGYRAGGSACRDAPRTFRRCLVPLSASGLS